VAGNATERTVAGFATGRTLAGSALEPPPRAEASETRSVPETRPYGAAGARVGPGCGRHRGGRRCPGISRRGPAAWGTSVVAPPGQASGGEKTTITRRSSVMWWNRCGTPAGTYTTLPRATYVVSSPTVIAARPLITR
jgi:hypothetical protein